MTKLTKEDNTQEELVEALTWLSANDALIWGASTCTRDGFNDSAI
jgi:hypothetical protein